MSNRITFREKSVDYDNPFPVKLATSVKVRWETDTDWNKGTTTSNTEVSGSGAAAVVKLAGLTDNADNIPFDTSASYTPSDAAKIEVASSRARLKVQSGSDMNWPFTTPANYSYNAAQIDVTNGAASLNGITGVYAQWHLNESSGTAAADAGPNDYTATTVNMEDADWVAGKLNNCLRFDGANEYVDCGNIANFTHTSAFSIEAWVKTSTQSRMIMARHNGTRGWFFYIAAGGVPMFRLSNNYGANDLSRKTVGSIVDGAWHHVVATYDGNNTTTGIHTYIDGSLDDGATVSNLTATIQVGVNMRLAAWNSGLYLNGDMDEVLVYDKELTASEVTSRWNAGSGTEEENISTSSPGINPTTGFSFTAALNSYVETSTTPTGTNIRHIVSPDNGATYYWYDGDWTVSAGTYAEANSVATINTNIGTLTNTGTLVPRCFLYSDGGNNLSLDNIYVSEPVTYSTDDNLYVDTKDAAQIAPTNIIAWLTSNFTATTPANTHIGILHSVDGRTNWITYSGGWSTTGSPTLRASSISLSDVTANFPTLPLGSGTLDLRIFLKADTNTVTPELINNSVTSDAGLATTGEYRTNQYSSGYQDLDWAEVGITKTDASGGTTTIRNRAANTLGDLTNTSFGSALVDGDDAGSIGQYTEFKIELTGDGTTSPSVNILSVKYATPEISVVTP